jgi:hypothetical protein
LDYYLTLKKEATCSSETSVDFDRTTRRYVPEDITLRKLVMFVCLDRSFISFCLVINRAKMVFRGACTVVQANPNLCSSKCVRKFCVR